MTAPRILVIVGHPLSDTLCHALADQYIAGAAGADGRVIDLAADPVPGHPVARIDLRGAADLDPEVARSVELMEWAEHITVVYPQWWGTYPAALKSYIDRVFLAGRAFTYRPDGRANTLWKGRTVRFLTTRDVPGFWVRIFYHRAGERALVRATFGFVGIRTIGFHGFGRVRFSDADTRGTWLRRAETLGHREGRRAQTAGTLPTQAPEAMTTGR